jgi:hypothetical protein|tara:strand:+ start:712 stop:867 length:156 start_codon:yes stop_codon:yes gene_type:complete
MRYIQKPNEITRGETTVKGFLFILLIIPLLFLKIVDKIFNDEEPPGQWKKL